MISQRDAKTGRGKEHCEQGDVKPINTEIPQVKRHCRERENKCADQERTGRPVNAIGRNTENQGVNLGRITSSLISAENDVLLCPGMNAAAMGAGELLCFHFGCLPAFFFDCPSRVGQL